MKLDRKRNAYRGMFAGILNKTTVMVLPFVMRTIILYYLGTEYLGLSSLFSSVLGLFSLAELGVGSAMIYSMYKPIAEDDTDTICALLKLYRRLYRFIGFFILSAGLCFLPFIDQVIVGSVPDDINIHVLYLIYLTNSILTYFLFSYKNALLDAHQRKDIDLHVGSILTLIEYVLQIILILITRNYYVYVIIFPVFTLLGNLVRASIVTRLYPHYVCKGVLPKEVRKSIFSKITALSIHKLGYVISNSSGNIVISSFCGLTAVAVYGNYYYVIACIMGILSAIFISFTPGIGNKMILDSVEDNRRTFYNLFFINMWITIWASSCLLCLYQPFMEIWINKNPDLMVSFPTVVSFVVFFFIQQYRKVVCLYNDAAGIWKEDKWKPVLGAIANISLSIFLVSHIGISGVIIAASVSLLFIELPWESYVLFKYYFHGGSKIFIKKSVCFCIVAFICIITTFGLCAMLPSGGIMIFIGKMILCGLFPNLFLFIAFRKKQEYTYLHSTIISKFLKPIFK